MFVLNTSSHSVLPWLNMGAVDHGIWTGRTVGTPLPVTPTIPVLTPRFSSAGDRDCDSWASSCLPGTKGCKWQGFALGAAFREGWATRILSGPSTTGFQVEQGGKSCLCFSPLFMTWDLVTGCE